MDHTADLGIIVRGANLKNLFEEAARSMMTIMVRGRHVEKADYVKVSIAGEDLADLMVRWLGEILYLFEAEKKVVSDVGIESISPSNLEATLKTVSLDLEIHEILCEIKAVTYHQIEVVENGEHCETRIIFDV